MPCIHPLEIPEILHLILSCRPILRTEDLAVTSLVCKQWALISRRALWQDLELDSGSWQDPFYQSLSAQLSKYGAFVRTLTLKDCGAESSRFRELFSMMTTVQTILVDRLMLHNRSSVLLQSLELLSFSHLRYLRLPHVSSLTNGTDVLLRICESSWRMQHLEIMDSEVDDKALAIIAKTCPNMRTLDLSRNEVVTFNGVFNDYGQEAVCSGDGLIPREQEEMTKNENILASSSSTTMTPTRPKSVSITHQHQQKHPPIYTNHTSTLCSLHIEEPPTLLRYDIPFMHLQELNLVFCLGITNGGFQTLFRSFRGKSLRSLDLQFTNIEDSGLEALATAFCPYTSASRNPARACHAELTSVKVSYCSKITARGIRALVTMCPQLLELEFLCCDLVSADCFKGPVSWACTGLRRLEFTLHPTPLFSNQRQAVEAEERESMISAPHQVPEHALAGVPDIQQPPRSQDKDLIDGQGGSQEWSKMEKRQHVNTEGHRLFCEQESIRTDYHAMFKQLKLLSDLQSLHIYNSAAPNTTASLYGPDQEEASASSAPENAVNLNPSTYSAPPPARTEHDRMEGIVASIASGSSLTEAISRQESEDFQDNSNGEISAESSHTYTESISAAVSRTIIHGPPPLTLAPVHPFSLRMGFKALRRLKNLQTLTLYERSSISLGESEVWWIGRMFPQLSLLGLRGSIEISDHALERLKAMRPRVHMQVSPLFDR